MNSQENMGASKLRVAMADFRDRKLEAFTRNCNILAERVAAGQMRLLDAADMLQNAAELSGLCEVAGDDVVQQVMAAAFTRKRLTVST